METVKAYYRLTKPGIIYGNVMHAVAGWLLSAAVNQRISIMTLLSVALGTGLVIASACIVNNFTDRGIDEKMKRTMHRPSVTGRVKVSVGLILATVFLGLGIGILMLGTNWLTVVLGLIAYVIYVGPYGYAKRHTPFSTHIGTIPGALPVVAGVTAVSGQLDWLAIGLGLLLVIWQMAHFYAIAMFRKDEYGAAELPIISVVRSEQTVQKRIVMYVWLYVGLVAGMGLLMILPPIVSIMLFLGGVYWMYVAYSTKGISLAKWGRKVFGASLVLTMLLLASGLIAIVAA